MKTRRSERRGRRKHCKMNSDESVITAMTEEENKMKDNEEAQREAESRKMDAPMTD